MLSTPDIKKYKPEMFIYDNDHVMTVFLGTPFYRSTGENSQQEGTFFPHRGIYKSDGWIMKPKLFSVPDEVLQFCRVNKIDEEVALKRFGNLRTLCISASLNTGFWQRKSGIKLEKFLRDNYPAEYFLDKKVVAEFMHAYQTMPKDNFDANHANAKLKALGAIIPLNEKKSRLPYFSEIDYFPTQTTENMREALGVLLLQKETISKETLKHLEILISMPEIFSYVIDNHLLEDQEQVENINRLMTFSELAQLTSDKDYKLDLQDFIAFNRLISPVLNYKEYKNLCGDTDFRKLIRHLNKQDAMDKDDLKLIQAMLDEDLSSKDIHALLSFSPARNLLKRYLDREKFDLGEIISLVDELYDHNALDTYIKLIENTYLEKMIVESLQRKITLTSRVVKLIYDLDQEGLLSSALKLLKLDPPKTTIKLIADLLIENKLNDEVLYLIYDLDFDNLVTKNLDLLRDDNARNILLKVIEEYDDDNNEKYVNIVKDMFEANLLSDKTTIADVKTFIARYDSEKSSSDKEYSSDESSDVFSSNDDLDEDEKEQSKNSPRLFQHQKELPEDKDMKAEEKQNSLKTPIKKT